MSDELGTCDDERMLPHREGLGRVRHTCTNWRSIDPDTQTTLTPSKVALLLEAVKAADRYVDCARDESWREDHDKLFDQLCAAVAACHKAGVFE